MKILFLDIDGVLNSLTYYEGKTEQELSDHPFDPENVAQLKKIVAATGAEIVLTSSWRGGWDQNPENCNAEGRILNRLFAENNMKILDKTPALSEGGRTGEIRAYINAHSPGIENYVIIDDNDFGWKANRMDAHVVMTDFLDGGLTDVHVQPAIDILCKKSLWKKELLLETIRNRLRKGKSKL